MLPDSDVPARTVFQVDPDNPYAVETMISPSAHIFYRALERLKDTGLLEKDEKFFYKQPKEKIPGTLVCRLRFCFWQEYDATILHKKKYMHLVRIFSPVCTEKVWNKILEDDLSFAFILCPPTDYVASAKESLNRGMERLREILEAKITDEDGNLNPRAAEVLLKTVVMLDNRVKGAVIQKIDQRMLQVTTNIPAKQMQLPPGEVEELNKLIEETKHRLASSPLQQTKEPVLIDVKKNRN